MKKYQFNTANMDTCTFEIVGEYTDGCADVAVTCGDLCREFDEIDGGAVEDIFAWLIDEGVAFERPQSLWANLRIVQSVMLDGDDTAERIIGRAGSRTADDLGYFLSCFAEHGDEWHVSRQKAGDAGIDGETYRDPAQAVRRFFDVLDECAGAPDPYTVCLGAGSKTIIQARA